MVKKLDYINIGLMLLSAILAIQLPFKLFLFVYAVLGPLHYLTEIGWLHKRNYFINGIQQWSWIWIVAIFTGLAVVFRYSFFWEHSKGVMNEIINYDSTLIKAVLGVANDAVYLTFVMAVAFVLGRKLWQRILSFGLGLFFFFVVKDLSIYKSLVVILLPSIIHVSVFTWVFMLNGALKNKSAVGYVSVAMFVVLVFLFFVIPFSWIDATSDKTVFDMIKNGGFFYANIQLLKLINEPANIFYSQIGVRMQCFIAFAYTYHYLNWFSKTEVIKWHQVSKNYLVLTLVLWIFSVGVYYYDYILGVVVLFMLSMAHVMLEFPLNIRSFIELKNHIVTKK